MPNQNLQDGACELSTSGPSTEYPLMEPLFELPTPEPTYQGGLI